jgi:hypothetical protein
MKTEGFKGCIGFVDGKNIPLYQRPGRDGKVYWDWKKRYLINCQVICDCDKFITSFMTGWPGSWGNSLVFKKMTMHTAPEDHFDAGILSLFPATHSVHQADFSLGQYLLADFAYALSMTCIPAYKAPTANIPVNTEFNYCIAKSCIWNEHTIGILKGRWASLQQLRLALNNKKDMKEIIRWISACVILHNLLAHLGNAWEDLDDKLGSPKQQSSSESISASSKDFCNKVQEKCIQYNYAVGTLPIQL